jgi:hypothetical protein
MHLTISNLFQKFEVQEKKIILKHKKASILRYGGCVNIKTFKLIEVYYRMQLISSITCLMYRF